MATEKGNVLSSLIDASLSISSFFRLRMKYKIMGAANPNTKATDNVTMIFVESDSR